MHRRSFVVAAAVVTGLVLGILIGPTLRGSTASAQAQPPKTAQAGGMANLRNLFLDKLASVLKIQRPTLDSAIKDAGTSTVDDAVKQGQLSQAQADKLKAEIQSGNAVPFWGGRGQADRGHGNNMLALRQGMLAAAAKQLNLTPAELTQQLRNGQTLAQLAQAHQTTEQAVVNAALAAAKTQLDDAVTKGTLTRAQADAEYARLQQAGAKIFNFGNGRGGRGGQGQPGAQPQKQSSQPGA